MDEKTYVFGQDTSNLLGILTPLLQQRGIDPSTLVALTNSNGFGGNGSWFIWILFLLIFAGGGWGNGFGGFGGNGTGFLSNQINDTAGRDLLMQAIQGGKDAVSSLATRLNTDISTIQSGIYGLNSAMQSVGSQIGMSGLQIQNAILSGNSDISRQLFENACNIKTVVAEQGYENRIQTIEQTNQLGAQADRNTLSITTSIGDLKTAMTSEFCALKERELQNKIDSLTAANTSLKSEISNSAQTAQIAQMIAPLQAELSSIKASQPNTVPVQWPNLTAVNTTPYVSGGYYYGYGQNNSIWS